MFSNRVFILRYFIIQIVLIWHTGILAQNVKFTVGDKFGREPHHAEIIDIDSRHFIVHRWINQEHELIRYQIDLKRVMDLKLSPPDDYEPLQWRRVGANLVAIQTVYSFLDHSISIYMASFSNELELKKPWTLVYTGYTLHAVPPANIGMHNHSYEKLNLASNQYPSGFLRGFSLLESDESSFIRILIQNPLPDQDSSEIHLLRFNEELQLAENKMIYATGRQDKQRLIRAKLVGNVLMMHLGRFEPVSEGQEALNWIKNDLVLYDVLSGANRAIRIEDQIRADSVVVFPKIEMLHDPEKNAFWFIGGYETFDKTKANYDYKNHISSLFYCKMAMATGMEKWISKSFPETFNDSLATTNVRRFDLVYCRILANGNIQSMYHFPFENWLLSDLQYGLQQRSYVIYHSHDIGLVELSPSDEIDFSPRISRISCGFFEKIRYFKPMEMNGESGLLFQDIAFHYTRDKRNLELVELDAIRPLTILSFASRNSSGEWVFKKVKNTNDRAIQFKEFYLLENGKYLTILKLPSGKDQLSLIDFEGTN